MPQELILRIYAVLRRSYKEDNPLVVLDGCTVDFDRAEVYKGNEIFFLTAKEHMLLTLAAMKEKLLPLMRFAKHYGATIHLVMKIV